MDEIAARLLVPQRKGAVFELGRDLGVGVAGADSAVPILRESGNRQIMARHRKVYVLDDKAQRSNPAAHFRLFTGYQPLVEAAHAFQDLAANESVAAAEFDFAGRCNPVEIEHAIVK